MDRISALRNVEEALSSFEAGEMTLPELERSVRATVRTYATDFEDGMQYRARGPSAVDGLVVVADSRAGARAQLDEMLTEPLDYEIEPVE